jgi:hypothetical protein
MFAINTIRRFWAGSKRQTKPRRRVVPQLESLEDRTAPAVFTVNTIADTHAANLITGQDAQGHISLRSAIEAANHLGGANTINLANSTCTFAPAASELQIKDNLALIGTGVNAAINANGQARVFHIFQGFSATIQNVTITGGMAGQGGGIFNEGTLILSGDTIAQNTAAVPGYGQSGFGGGIYNAGQASLTISQCSIHDNQALGEAGAAGTNGTAGAHGISGGSVGIGQPGIAGTNGSAGTDGGPGSNAGSAFGGGIYNAGGTVTIDMSSIYSNQASGGAGGMGGTGGSGSKGGAGGYGGAGISSLPGGAGGQGGNGGDGGVGGLGGNGGNAFGGALYTSGGTVVIENSAFSKDQAQGGNSGLGGTGGAGGAGGRGGAGGSNLSQVPPGRGGAGGAGGNGGWVAPEATLGLPRGERCTPIIPP